jgi:two-component system, NtrC family, nitrogen regulation sensor histidine kinase NtrY
MSFRRRLLLLFALTVLVSITIVTLIISGLARRAFDRSNDERSAALVVQFRREFTRRGEDIAHKLQAIAATPEAGRIALAAARLSPEYSPFLDTAQSIAESQQLDFLEFTDDRGTIISSAQWPAKFGYNEPVVSSPITQNAFLKREELPSGSALGLFSMEAIPAGDRKLYIVGGARLDKTFLSNIELPAGMRVWLYQIPEKVSAAPSAAGLIAAGATPAEFDKLSPLLQRVQSDTRESSIIVQWNSGEEEMINAFPLSGSDNRLLAILLVGSSRHAYADLRHQIRFAALLAAGIGLLFSIVLSSWMSARITRPVEHLARAAHEVSAGNWNAQVQSDSRDEIGELADSFNRMTRELTEQQQRLVQAERVAAWRELARRLAHELKNPLFPLQLTVENLLRAREQNPQQFDEVFQESAASLLAEISNLKAIIGRFSEFSRMPQPQLRATHLREIVQDVARLYQPQLEKANIHCKLEFTDHESLAADPDLLHRALSNLVLNAIDAMPHGGTLTLRTSQSENSTCVEVSDTGAGLSSEERARLFTPYYTSKTHGTGLGLAIVQSIVSDHGGRISVSSQPGRGTTFIIELPANREKLHSEETRAQGR